MIEFIEAAESRIVAQGSEERDSDSESTLVSASRSSSTLNSTSELEYDARIKDREIRREERKRIIAERHAIRSRANSISDESHSPTCPNPVLCRRFSRDIESASASWMSSFHNTTQTSTSPSHCPNHSHGPSCHLYLRYLLLIQFQSVDSMNDDG